MALQSSSCSSGLPLPTLFIPHGGGPLPILNPDDLSASLSNILKPNGEIFKTQEEIDSIKSILFVSAHWEESQATLTHSLKDPNDNLLFDYSGFPKECYEYKWNAKGDVNISEKFANLLTQAGIEVKFDNKRKFDHGVFVPGLLMLPNPDEIPIIQLSLLNTLNPLKHIELGQALQSLRYEGVLIIASGLSYHNMGGFFGQVKESLKHSIEFDQWLHHTLADESVNFEERIELLSNWKEIAPYAKECHPREEHLIPLHVAVGAAGSSAKGRRFFNNKMMSGVKISGWVFEG